MTPAPQGTRAEEGTPGDGLQLEVALETVVVMGELIQDLDATRFHPQEQRQIEQVPNPRRRLHRASGYRVAHQAMAKLGFDTPIGYDPKGRPEIAGGRIAITHGDDGAGAMVSRRTNIQLGLDLERIAPRVPGFEDDWFTAGERAELADWDDRDFAITRRWTLKEAILKARGVGLTAPLRPFRYQRLVASGWTLWKESVLTWVIQLEEA